MRNAKQTEETHEREVAETCARWKQMLERRFLSEIPSPTNFMQCVITAEERTSGASYENSKTVGG